MVKNIKVIIALIILMGCLNGCALLAFGGGAGAGFFIGKDKRGFGEIVDDASITASVKARLIKDPKVKAFDVNVDTEEGKVTLHGHVGSRKIRNRAIKLARSVKGVRKVISKLEVIP
ncbi:MAG: BON domain-containing protein [Nitrospiria bacterium]